MQWSLEHELHMRCSVVSDSAMQCKEPVISMASQCLHTDWTASSYPGPAGALLQHHLGQSGWPNSTKVENLCYHIPKCVDVPWLCQTGCSSPLFCLPKEPRQMAQ